MSFLINYLIKFYQMKLNFKYAMMAVAALTLGLTSCSNDDEVTSGETDNGRETYMKVSINFPSTTQTRATDDVNATDDEADVKTVDVYLYSGSGAYISHTSLAGSDFTPDAAGNSKDGYTAKTKIKTTTGEKNVYVGINLPSSVASALENKPMSALAATATSMTRAEMTNLTNGLPMFSSTPANTTLVEDDTQAANTVTVKAERLVAKVTVESAPTMVVAGVSGTLGDLEFAIYNFNEKQFLVQGASPYKDPNWANLTTIPTADFSQPSISDWADVLDGSSNGSPSVDDYEALYASENTSEGKRKGEITRVVVRATFIPATITVYTNGSDNAGGYSTTNNTTPSTTPVTFYAVTPSVSAGTSYFINPAVAADFAADKGGTVETYTNGYAYWHMYLNKDASAGSTRYDVLRNDYLKCNITRIVAPGRSTPGITEPEDKEKPDADTNITTNIEVLFWNTPILNDYELEP